MYSMTGFGRAKLTTLFGTLNVELTSVNNRFLEMSIRLPRQLMPLENKVRELIASKISRGQVNLSISLDESDSANHRPLINKKLASAYARQLKALQKELGIAGEVTVADLLAVPDILKPDKESLDLDAAWSAINKALSKAFMEMLLTRRKEGLAMARDMAQRLKAMRATITQVEKLSVNSVENYREKLNQKIGSLLDPAQRNQLRVEEEIALLAERTDITEECTRLKAHIDLFQQTLKMKEPAGKRLNFILQEMNREANTIGSKCSEFSISSLAIALKEEIEKLRELVQNVE